MIFWILLIFLWICFFENSQFRKNYNLGNNFLEWETIYVSTDFGNLFCAWKLLFATRMNLENFYHVTSVQSGALNIKWCDWFKIFLARIISFACMVLYHQHACSSYKFKADLFWLCCHGNIRCLPRKKKTLRLIYQVLEIYSPLTKMNLDADF